MGDVYNSANNDVPITIAKRYGIAISSFLQQNLEQQPMLRGKSKLNALTLTPRGRYSFVYVRTGTHLE